MILSISVENYKSIKKLESFKLNPINILIGDNGSGKTNFLNLLRFIREIYYQNLQSFVAKNKGASNFLTYGENLDIKISIQFDEARYHIELGKYKDSLVIKQESVHSKFNQETTATNDFESKIIDHAYEMNDVDISLQSYVSSKLKKLVYYDFSNIKTIDIIENINDSLFFSPSGENLTAFLYRLKQHYSTNYNEVVSKIRQAFPFFDDFVITADDNTFRQIQWKSKYSENILNFNLFSAGVIRFICLTTLLSQPYNLIPETIIIDEPHLGLDGRVIKLLANMMKQIAIDKQIIITTQRIDLINAFEPQDIIGINLVNGESIFRRLSDNNLGIRDFIYFA